MSNELTGDLASCWYERTMFKESITIFQFSSHTTLVRTLAHEFGHAQGLEHSKNPGSIMYYRIKSDTNGFAPEDIAAMQAPDVVWVGMSTPKQERWMYEHQPRLRVPLMAGVGAAFDFIAGTVKQAPAWMQENGLEWSFRLVQEPRRLWRRYLVFGSKFVWNVSFELLGLRKFE